MTDGQALSSHASGSLAEGLNALSAQLLAYEFTVLVYFHALNIGLKLPFGGFHGVAAAVPELGAFATTFANSHGESPFKLLCYYC